MTLFIVRSEHRDMQAINAKLDEILPAQDRGSHQLVTLDHREPEGSRSTETLQPAAAVHRLQGP
jgi:low affinity Fe/Cu permease